MARLDLGPTIDQFLEEVQVEPVWGIPQLEPGRPPGSQVLSDPPVAEGHFKIDAGVLYRVQAPAVVMLA